MRQVLHKLHFRLFRKSTCACEGFSASHYVTAIKKIHTLIERSSTQKFKRQPVTLLFLELFFILNHFLRNLPSLQQSVTRQAVLSDHILIRYHNVLDLEKLPVTELSKLPFVITWILMQIYFDHYA